MPATEIARAHPSPGFPVVIPANELTGVDIGRTIRFVLFDGPENDIEVVRTAELRQIYLVGDEVHITYGAGAEHESLLAWTQPVQLTMRQPESLAAALVAKEKK